MHRLRLAARRASVPFGIVRLAMALWLCCLLSSLAFAQAPAAGAVIDIEARFFDYGEVDDSIEAHDLVITYGNIRLTADRALSSSSNFAQARWEFTGLIVTMDDLRFEADRALASSLNLADARWDFSGNVRMSQDNALLQAAAVQVQFRDSIVVHAVAEGAPMRFDDPGVLTNRQMQGQANRMEYDLAQSRVRLTGEPQLRVDGDNEIAAPVVTYDLATRGIRAERDDDERVRITIPLPPGGSSTGDNPAP